MSATLSLQKTELGPFICSQSQLDAGHMSGTEPNKFPTDPITVGNRTLHCVSCNMMM